MSTKPKTIKELKEQRRKENFVGRAEQQHVFLDNFTGDEVKWVVLSVTGEGGVGKSTLLKRYTQLAQGNEINVNVVYCDDRQYTPVDVMAVIANQLEKFGIESKKFNERYKKYRETLQQIESDPTAPRGMVNVVTRGLTDFTIKSLRRLPGVGVAADYVDEKAAGDAMADLAQYALTRWGNKDEVSLVREPEKILSPLFVELLNEATEKKRLIVMFDVFERTAATLSSWIIELLDGKHDDLGLGVSFIVCGRDPLEQHWTELAGLIAHIQLEPFTLEETTIYLSNQDIKDEILVKQIHEDTGGLPVLVELLASTKPQPGNPLPDISKDAVERFLQWTPDEEKRHATLIAAVPRQFNQEILQAILGQDKGKELFHWLAEQSFVRSNTERGYFYHDKVRVLMLRHQKHVTPGELAAAHTKLIDYFSKSQTEIGLQGKEAYKKESWRKLELEHIYHHVSTDSEKNFAHIVDSFLSAFLYRWEFSRTLIKTATQAMGDFQHRFSDNNLQKIEQMVDYYNENNYEQIKFCVNDLQNTKGISDISKSICFFYKGYSSYYLDANEDALINFSRAIELDQNFSQAIAYRGEVYRWLKRYEEALTDFTRAIELNEKYDWAIAGRGQTYQSMQCYEEALTDFTRAIELNEKSDWAIASRGETYHLMERYEEALADFTRAIELNEKYDLAIASRGQTYQSMQRYEEALADFTRAIELDEKYVWAIVSRGQIYQSMERYEEALADFTRAIELDEKYVWAIVSRGQIYQSMERYEEALANFTRAIELNEKYAWAIASRGQTYQSMQRYEEALADFTRAIELDEKYVWAIINRGQTYQSLERYEKALVDFTHAIELDEKYTWAYVSRGQTYQSMQRYEEALADFTRAIELDEKYVWAIINRGQTYQSLERYEKALADFTHAIELDEKYTWAYVSRGKIYQSMEHYEEALADFTRAIELDEKYAWVFGQRAIINYIMGKFDQALQDFSRRMELDENDIWACSWRGEVYRRTGKYDLALIDFTKAIETGKASPDDIACRAATYFALGDSISAQRDLDRVLSLECKEPVHHYGRALALILSDRIPESFAELEIAFTDKFFRQRSRVDNLLNPIRDLPNFKAILAKYE